jgi:hypothetical protein
MTEFTLPNLKYITTIKNDRNIDQERIKNPELISYTAKSINFQLQ